MSIATMITAACYGFISDFPGPRRSLVDRPGEAHDVGGVTKKAVVEKRIGGGRADDEDAWPIFDPTCDGSEEEDDDDGQGGDCCMAVRLDTELAVVVRQGLGTGTGQRPPVEPISPARLD